jgi:hypothetical protein
MLAKPSLLVTLAFCKAAALNRLALRCRLMPDFGPRRFGAHEGRARSRGSTGYAIKHHVRLR